MPIAPAIRLIDIPRRFPGEDLDAFLNRFATAFERLRDSVGVQEDTGIFRDTAGRIILDADGLHIFDGAGTEVIDANTLALDSGHLLSSGLLASSIKNGEISEQDADHTASTVTLSTNYIVVGTATHVSEGLPATVWASLSVDITSTAAGSVAVELRLRRDSTTLVEAKALSVLGTDVAGIAMPGIVHQDTSTATGSRNYDVAARITASTATAVVSVVSIYSLELAK